MPRPPHAQKLREVRKAMPFIFGLLPNAQTSNNGCQPVGKQNFRFLVVSPCQKHETRMPSPPESRADSSPAPTKNGSVFWWFPHAKNTKRRCPARRRAELTLRRRRQGRNGSVDVVNIRWWFSRCPAHLAGLVFVVDIFRFQHCIPRLFHCFSRHILWQHSPRSASTFPAPRTLTRASGSACQGISMLPRNLQNIITLMSMAKAQQTGTRLSEGQGMRLVAGMSLPLL